MPILRALSAILSWMPVPEKTMSPAGMASIMRSLRLKGAAFLLHQQFERAEAPASGRNFELPRFLPFAIEQRPHVEALEQSAAGDVRRQRIERYACLHAPHIGLRQAQAVERNVARRYAHEHRGS